MSDQSWVGVAQRNLPPTFSQVRNAERELEKRREGDKLFETAIESEWIAPAVGRMIDRDKEFSLTEGYKVPETVQADLARDWGYEMSREITKGVVSEEDLNFRLANADADRKRAEVLSRNGFSGVGAQLGAALLDPAGWGLSIVAAPVAGAIKVKRLGHVFKTALVAGAENAALEAVLAENDYTRDIDNVFAAAGLGMVLGGTIGAVTRNRANGLDRPEGTPRPETATVVEGADEFDKAASVAVREAMEYDAYMAARNYEPLRARDVDNELEVFNHTERLTADARVRMSSKEKGLLKREIRQLEDEITSMGGRKTDEMAEAAAAVGVPKGKGERLDLDVARAAIARSYDEPIKDLTARVDELKGKLSRGEGVDAAKAELKRFANLDRQAQIRELGLDVEPRRVDQTSAVKEALAALKAERKATPTMKHDDAKAADEAKAAQRDDSVGAARVKDSEIEGEQFDLSDSMEDLMDTLAREAYSSNVKPRKWAGNAGSVSSVVLRSENAVFRGLGLRILENAQGGAYHGKTASILSNVNNNLIRSAEKNRYNDGFSQFLKDNNLKAADYLNPATTRDFNNQIYTAIVKGIPADTPAGVKLAAEGIADKFAKGLELRKSGGEKGFEDVTSAADYMPVIFDGIGVTQAVNRMGGKEGVIGLLSKGYQTGKYKMGKKAADALAKVQYIRASDSTLSSRLSFDRVVSQQQQAQLVEDLRKAGVPDNIIDNFIEGEELAEMANSISNRAKSSMGINTQAEINGVKVQDLLNTNVGELAENYGKEAAGGAAFARMGFPTRQSVLNAIDAGERAGRNMAGADTKAIKQLRGEAEMLRDSVKMIYGNTIDADPNSAIVRGTRRVREVTGLLRLQQMGFAQMSEISRAITKLGLGTVLSSVPATKFLRSRAAREGGTARGAVTEPELREMEELIGYIGEDNWLSGWNVRHDEFGESADTVGRLTAIADNALAAGGRVNTILSGFKAIQGGSEKIVARSINKRLKEHLSGGKQLPQRDLDEVGLNVDTMVKLKRHFDDNPAHADYNGQQVRMMNFEAMEPELRETVGVAVRRMSGRLIQRNFIGDEGMWMNKWWGKALTQFKSFSLVSIEKQLIHDLRGDKLVAAQILGWSSLLAFAAYSTQMQMQAIGRADRDKFLEDKFSAHNMAMGTFNKMPQVAGLSLGGDFLATLGLMPDSMMQAPGRMGFQQQGFSEIVAGAGVVGDVFDFSRHLAKYATGDDDVSTRQIVDKMRRLVPFTNSIGVGQMSKAGVDLLEE
ncbi:putative internal virion protein [Lelliottia phage phD2B]|uniref:Putative internal virion protein n=1 Tax=Lelliottia phage phD2B TaxID=1542498 RepID=A0A088FS42_9CAUD|nr:putative internal virion protein [Lelliottia phage phD2B]AIM51263.1 putative internal virion protein [Lelliottia phage phD2B]